MEAQIQLKHPQGKKAVSISKDRYEFLKTETVKYLTKNSDATFSDLSNAIANEIKKRKIRFDGSLNWYLEWVKLDLEAQQIISRVSNSSPQKYSLKNK